MIELDRLPRAHRLVILAELQRRVLAARLLELREAERVVCEAVDARVAAELAFARVAEDLEALLRMVSAARDLDDAERSEALRRRVA